ncbi:MULTISPECIES: polysaccharide deacetylase family protein [unclassified Halanaerobium]|uniref:polysaccharide deacetylase family protein n=1 Tax=unclassified Halanaerobium TaxID=2641197 RepID=UPI000DF40466|nr:MULTISPECIES: polysaccharide deacetylase family protein [unclassified Halanaerobium]RCW48809.1 polysaccharide deacetylase [Halanaerobium sp. MA284_MarDTE_T2]RCW89151.1 polysaccharide deacetylase [Halanaerobium sp. DL-01]
MKKIFYLIVLISFICSLNISAEKLPALVIMYDDGFKEDMELAYPVHRENNIPAVAAVNTSEIGEKGRLTEEDIIKLSESGWEIAGHGHYHTALIFHSIKEKVNSGEKEIAVRNSFLMDRRYDYIIFNVYSSKGEKISISKIERKNNKNYIILDLPLKLNYPKEGSYVRISDNSMKDEILKPKNILKDMGLEVSTFVYPYNGHFKLAQDYVSQYYAAARAGHRKGQIFPEAFLNKSPFSKYNLKGTGFEKNLITDKDLNYLLEKTAEEKALLILYGHPKNEFFSVKRLKHIIDYSNKLDINITTLNKIFN